MSQFVCPILDLPDLPGAPVYQVRSRVVSGPGEGTESSWQQTPWGRIGIGVLLAQGLYYGLRQLCTAGLLASGDNTVGSTWTTTLLGLLLLQAIQVLGVVVAGLLAGAGLRQGIVYGAVVGVWNGVLSVAVPSAPLPQTVVTLLGQPILHTAFGALGGFLGSCIWRPPPVIQLPAVLPTVPQPNLPTSTRLSLFAGPTAWGRIVAGTALAVGGTLWANVILELLLEASEGNLSISSQLQAQLVTWEVMALAMLVGSAVAGSCMINGLKQGLYVGLAAAVVLIGLRLSTNPSAWFDAFLTFVSCLCLGLAGGWFGGSLFPPIVSMRKRKGLGPETL